MEKKIREKTTKKDHYDGEAYREIKTLDTSSVSVELPKKAASADLRKLAMEQIAKNCSVTAKLIGYFTDVNAHQIYAVSGGKIVYDTSTGTFRTPVGVVVQENVNEARSLLHNTLAPFVERGDTRNTKFIRALEQYLMLIPKDIGRTFDAEVILGTQAKVQEQEQILDALEASIKSIVSASTSPKDKKAATVDLPRLFSVKMEVIDDKGEIARIQRKYNETVSGMHRAVSGMRVKAAYTIDIADAHAAFNAYGKTLPNIWELWHGSKSSHCLSILKTGLKVPPSNAPYITGAMFSRGLYFSDQSSKSLQYATNFWGGKDEGRYFMFLSQVAMGNYMIPRGPTNSQPPHPYNSYFAKGGRSGVHNNEMIIPREDQHNLTHLIEFGK
jgi:poly [ADP-ribose] polymerase